MQTLTTEFWHYVNEQKNKTKIASKVYDWLDRDYLGEIIKDGNTFWIEDNSFSSVPNYIYDYIKKWGKRLGYKHLND